MSGIKGNTGEGKTEKKIWEHETGRSLELSLALEVLSESIH